MCVLTCQGHACAGDVRDFCVRRGRGTPPVAAKPTTEHPHVTANCEITSLRWPLKREGNAGGRLGLVRWLAPPWPQSAGEIIEGQMAAAVDCYLDQLEAADAADRRNGYYRRRLLAELGDIELTFPGPAATARRGYSRLCATHTGDRPGHPRPSCSACRRARWRDGACLAWAFGEPSTVSQVAKTLDAAVAAFHRRPPQNATKR